MSRGRKLSRYSVATVDAELREAIAAAPRDPAWLAAVLAVVRDPGKLAAVASEAPTTNTERRRMLVALCGKLIGAAADHDASTALAMLAEALPTWADELREPRLATVEIDPALADAWASAGHRGGPGRMGPRRLAAYLCVRSGALGTVGRYGPHDERWYAPATVGPFDWVVSDAMTRLAGIASPPTTRRNPRCAQH